MQFVPSPSHLHCTVNGPLPMGYCFTTVQYSHFILAWGFLMLVLLTLLIHIMSTYFLSQRVYMYTSQWCYFNNWSGIPMIQSNLTTLTFDTCPLSTSDHKGFLTMEILAAESTPAGIPSGGKLMLIGRQHVSYNRGVYPKGVLLPCKISHACLRIWLVQWERGIQSYTKWQFF